MKCQPVCDVAGPTKWYEAEGPQMTRSNDPTESFVRQAPGLSVVRVTDYPLTSTDYMLTFYNYRLFRA